MAEVLQTKQISFFKIVFKKFIVYYGKVSFLTYDASIECFPLATLSRGRLALFLITNLENQPINGEILPSLSQRKLILNKSDLFKSSSQKDSLYAFFEPSSSKLTSRTTHCNFGYQSKLNYTLSIYIFFTKLLE